MRTAPRSLKARFGEFDLFLLLPLERALAEAGRNLYCNPEYLEFYGRLTGEL